MINRYLFVYLIGKGHTKIKQRMEWAQIWSECPKKYQIDRPDMAINKVRMIK